VAPGISVTAPGTPLFASNMTPETGDIKFPQIKLTTKDQPRDEVILNASVQWLALLAGVWVLSFFPALLGWVKPLWPEQLAILGAVGLYLAGANPISYCLLGVAVLARLLYVAGWGRWLLEGLSRRKAPSTNARPGSAPRGN
jgi:hypothetical protein